MSDGKNRNMVAELNAAIVAILAPETKTPEALAKLFRAVFDYLWETVGADLPTGTVRELLPTVDTGLGLGYLPLDETPSGETCRMTSNERAPTLPLVLQEALECRVFGPLGVGFTNVSNFLTAIFLTRDRELLGVRADFALTGMAYHIERVQLVFFGREVFEKELANQFRNDPALAPKFATGLVAALEKAGTRMQERIRESERRFERIVNATAALRAVPAALAHIASATPPAAG